MRPWLFNTIPPPVKLLTIFFVFCLSVLTYSIWELWRLEGAIHKEFPLKFDRERLGGKIDHLGELLAMSSRMGATTGDLEWEADYLRHEKELTQAIEDAKSYQITGVCLDQISTARDKRVEMEKKAFMLVHEGQLESATELLRHPEYEAQKGFYHNGTACFFKNTSQYFERELKDHRSDMLRVFLYAIPMPLLAFIVLVFTVKQYLIEREQSQEELSESEVKFRQLADTTAVVFWIASSDGKQGLYINSAYEKIWGRSRESFYKDFTSWISAIHPADRERVSQAWSNIVVTGKYDIEYRVVQPSGEIRWVHAQGGPVRDDQGEIYRFAGTAEDITDSKRLIWALERSEETYRTIAQAMNDALISIKGPDGVIALWNKKAEAMFGYAADEALGKNLHQLIVPERYRQNAHDGMRKFFATGEGAILGRTLEVFALRRDGSEFPVELSTATMRTSNGWEAIATVRDATERKKAEQERLQLEAIINSSPDFIGFADAKDTRIRYVNPAGRKMCGLGPDEDVTQLRIADVHPGWANKLLAEVVLPTAAREGVWVGDCAFLDRDGREIPVLMVLTSHANARGEIETFATISRDITQKIEDDRNLRFAETQLMLSEKLAGIGQLSAGVCHEILNPLNIISIQTQLLLRREEGNPDLRERLTKIRGEIGRIEKIVSLLMTFARKGIPEFIPVQINAELDAALSLVEKDFNLDNIKIIRDWQSPSPEVEADTDELRQVFLNLVNNARYEMRSGGTLTVKTRREKIGGRDHVRICFSDTGAGIKKEHLTKIFDPFFTTKPEGKGTGMGLSMAHSIVEKHGGTIRAESEEGKGATIIIDLPVKPR